MSTSPRTSFRRAPHLGGTTLARIEQTSDKKARHNAPGFARCCRERLTRSAWLRWFDDTLERKPAEFGRSLLAARAVLATESSA